MDECNKVKELVKEKYAKIARDGGISQCGKQKEDGIPYGFVGEHYDGKEYTTEIVTRLRFIKRAQELGFFLREISELLALRVIPKQDCSGVKKRAESKLEEIERKICDLKRMQRVLNEVTKACVASRPISDCPILKSFEKKISVRKIP